MTRRQQITIGAIDGLDVDVLASFLEQAFDVTVIVGNWANGIPEGMLVLEKRNEK